MARFNIALANRKESVRWSFLAIFSQPLARPLFAGLAAVFIVIVAAGGTIPASANSVPGDTLYWVKTTRENVNLVMPRSGMDKAQIHAQLATTRGEEMRVLIQRGRFIEAEMMMQRFRHQLNQSATNAGFILLVSRIEMPIRPLDLENMQNAQELRQLLVQDGTQLRIRMAALVKQTPPPQQRRVRGLRKLLSPDTAFPAMLQQPEM